MMNHLHRYMRPQLMAVVAAACLTLLAASCRKETVGNETFRFTATTERPADAQSDDSKVMLYQERAIVWEYDDAISIGSNTSGSTKNTAWLYYNSAMPVDNDDFDDYNGVFLTTLPGNSEYFLGLHPHSDNNVIIAGEGSSFSTVTIDLPATQTYRNDSTFDKQVFPMVAWYGGTWSESPYTPFNLDFHSLGAIVRVQLFNSTGSEATIDYIDFTSDSKQLTGLFTVNNYKTNNPYLTATNNATNRTVRLDFSEYGPQFRNNELVTFYLVLPAIAGRERTTNYSLAMTVHNSNQGSCTRNMTVPTRRNGITYMQALSIDEWLGDDTTGTSRGLSGCGTITRPFKVYNIKDLQYLRDCYNSVGRRINGQEITRNTYIKLMRTDIVLTRSNWTVGIRDFIGHFESASSSSLSNPGIIDSCYDVPLFENIAADGEVVGISIKSAYTSIMENATGVSPFCKENSGKIKDCVITTIPGSSKKTLSIFSPFAGICVTNTSGGIIDGCRCVARVEVQNNHNFAGICLHNSGTIKGCQITTDVTVQVTGKAAGICYENTSTGIVEDSYFSAQIASSTADWGGIVYENSGTVKHCYINHRITTSKHVGGIVRTNLAGEVNYCYLEGQLEGQSVGGIVDSLVGGKMINCFTQDNPMLTIRTATSVCGGLVGYLKGGSIENSYALDVDITDYSNNATYGGIIGKATGGIVDNCYSLENYQIFYGSSSGATYTNCHLVDGEQIMSGISIVNSSTANAFETMQSALNTNKPVGGKSWTGADGNSTPPVLEGYSVSKRRH